MKRTHEIFFIAIPLVSLVVCADRLSKLFFLNTLSLGESIPVIRNIFHFTLVHNTGIAFGLFKDQGFIFIGVSLASVLFFSWMLFVHPQSPLPGRLSVVSFSLIISGAIGNLIDRLQYGFVIDFIDLRIWPVFNIADSAITIGACVFILTCIPSSAK
ncbi:MAG TPA: signal peptidase II [Candidatus Omnitrophota bacterium]|nr:signal peptidase II [Candidatus Omnitrophota bacterium]